MTEVNAKLKSAKISPRKVALIANQIRGKAVGRALDIDVIWDGFDIEKNLSRIIDVK